MPSGSMQQTSIPSPPPEPNDVDIIGYERISVAPDDDIHCVAEAALNSALEIAEYGAAGERNTYGNPRGLTLLEESHDMKAMMKRLDAQLQESKVEIADLQRRVKTLGRASEGYRKVRHRFLDVYRRDVRNDVDRQGRQKISEGNEAAHDGDAVVDASLYTSGQRHDEDVLVDLYGLNAAQISHLVRVDDFLSISTLNAGATWRATRPSDIPPDVDAAFQTFVNELSLNLGKSLTDGTTSLSKAYYAFQTAHQQQKLLQRGA